jgi:uncharacterized protein (TIGR03067 family)
MQRTLSLFWTAGMVLLLLTLAPPHMRAAITTPKKSWYGQLEDLALEKEVPGNGVIGNREDFAKLWKAWMGKEKVPEINFEKEFVVVRTARQFNFPVATVVLSVSKEGHAQPMIASGSRPNQKQEKKDRKSFAFAIGVFQREGLKTVQGKRLPSPVLVDDLRQEIKELQARVEELERKLSEPELKKLQGPWQFTQFVVNGHPESAESREGMQGVIRGNVIQLKAKDKGDQAMRISLDPTAKPAALDLAPDSEKGVRLKGIYELDKDTLKFCFTMEGSERPKAFSSKEDEGTVLIVLQRSQK